MFLLSAGAVVLFVTVALFWWCLPRGEEMHRLVGTEWEPYVAVAFCAGFALSFTMMVSAALGLLGNP